MIFTQIDDARLPKGMTAWQNSTRTRGLEIHFVICHEDGSTLEGADKLRWTGYTASWKTNKNPLVAQYFLAADDEPLVFTTFDEAVLACEAKLEELR